MGSSPQIGFHFVGRQVFLLSLFGLILFLSYLLLPPVYSGHPTAPLLPASQTDPRAGPPAIGTQPEESPEPYLQSNTGPICQEALNFQDYDFLSLPQVLDCANRLWSAAFTSHTPIIANPDFSLSGPRPPPVCP